VRHQLQQEARPSSAKIDGDAALARFTLKK
jgi:hypothetical protein